MSTLTGAVVDDEILLDVVVSIPNPPSEGGNPVLYKALLDTGAQGTSVSKKVVREVGLTTVSRDFITLASGETTEASIYQARLDIPGFTSRQGNLPTRLSYKGEGLDVIELPFEAPTDDVIIGMDFLQGFHITMCRGYFTISDHAPNSMCACKIR